MMRWLHALVAALHLVCSGGARIRARTAPDMLLDALSSAWARYFELLVAAPVEGSVGRPG